MFVRVVAVIAILALTIFYSVYKKQDLQSRLVPSTKGEAILAKLPSASFETLDGKPFDLDEFYQKESPGLVIVHYWGTWCAPCEAELPELITLIKQFSDRSDVKFLLVAVNDEKIKIEKHLKTLVLPKESQIYWLLDNQNVHRDIFGTTRVPETYVFSSDKNTLRKYVGPQEWIKPMFFQSLDDFHQISRGRL